MRFFDPTVIDVLLDAFREFDGVLINPRAVKHLTFDQGVVDKHQPFQRLELGDDAFANRRDMSTRLREAVQAVRSGATTLAGAGR